MPSLCVFEAEAVGYGVRGGPAHGVLAADHVRPVDLAPVVRGERDRGTVRVGDQEGHGAGPAGERPGRQRVGEVRAGRVHDAVHAQPVPRRPFGDPLARLVAGRAGQARHARQAGHVPRGHGVLATHDQDLPERPQGGLLRPGQPGSRIDQEHGGLRRVGVRADAQRVGEVAGRGQYGGGAPAGAFPVQLQGRVHTRLAGHPLHIGADAPQRGHHAVRHGRAAAGDDDPGRGEMFMVK